MTRKSSTHTGITVDVLLDALDSWASAYTEQAVAVTRFICETLFPVVKISPEEIDPALKRIETILRDSTHMVACYIAEVQRELQGMKTTKTRHARR